MKLNYVLKPTVSFYFGLLFIALLINPTSLLASVEECLFEDTHTDFFSKEKNDKNNRNDDEDLDSSDGEISTYEVPIYKDYGWVQGKLGQLYYEYVDMLEENRNILIFFDDLCSVLDTSQKNLRILPMVNFLGHFKQSCWIGSWCKTCRYDLNACYRFEMPYQCGEESVLFEFMKAQAVPSKVYADHKEADQEKDNNHNPSLSGKQTVYRSSLDFSYSPGPNSSLFSLDIILNPKRLLQQMSKSKIYDLSLVPLIAAHPYFNDYYIYIGCDGKLSQSNLVLEFVPKDASKLQNGQFLTDVFHGEVVLIPECGKQLTVLCSDLDEEQKIVIKVTGRLPPNLLPVVMSLLSPIPNFNFKDFKNFSFSKLGCLLFIISRINYTIGLCINGGRFGKIIAEAGLRRFPKLGEFSFVKSIRYHYQNEKSIHNKCINKATQIHDRIYNKAAQIGKRGCSKVSSLFLGWFSFNHLTGVGAQESESQEEKSQTAKAQEAGQSEAGMPEAHPHGMIKQIGFVKEDGTTSTYPLDCICNIQSPECTSEIQDISPERVALEKPLCDTFCLDPTCIGDRCQLGREALTRVFDAAEVSKDPDCKMKLIDLVPVEKSAMVPTCLGKYAKEKCTHLAKEGYAEDVLCDLCNAAKDLSLVCKFVPSIHRMGVLRIDGSTSSWSIKCLCNDKCSFVTGLRKLEKEAIEKPMCETFCLDPIYTEERCQVARNSLPVVFMYKDLLEHSKCDMDTMLTFLIEPSMRPTCLGDFTITRCSVLAREGNIKDRLCKLCNAAHDHSLHCKQKIIGDVQTTHLIGSNNTKSSTALLAPSTKAVTALETKLDVASSTPTRLPTSESIQESVTENIEGAAFPLPTTTTSPNAIADEIIKGLRMLGSGRLPILRKVAFQKKLAKAISGDSGNEVISELQKKVMQEASKGTVDELVRGLNDLGFGDSVDTAIDQLQMLTSGNISSETVEGIHQLEQSITDHKISEIFYDKINSDLVMLGLMVSGGVITIGGTTIALYCAYNKWRTRKNNALLIKNKEDEESSQGHAVFQQSEASMSDKLSQQEIELLIMGDSNEGSTQGDAVSLQSEASVSDKLLQQDIKLLIMDDSNKGSTQEEIVSLQGEQQSESKVLEQTSNKVNDEEGSLSVQYCSIPKSPMINDPYGERLNIKCDITLITSPEQKKDAEWKVTSFISETLRYKQEERKDLLQAITITTENEIKDDQENNASHKAVSEYEETLI